MNRHRAMRRLIIALVTVLTGCSEHKVDTFPEWCEQIAGVDIQKKYAPFWAVFPGVSFHGDAIRDSYTDFLDKSHLEKVQNRVPKMAWREGAQLHLINLSSFFDTEPNRVIAEWRKGIELDIADQLKDPSDVCLYRTLTSMFDSLHIHSMEADALGQRWTDAVTVIPTERQKRLGSKRL
ncbi:MAG: hypothetical protein K2X67_08390 [Burkholderiales bacterium]|jgi:hypothetical protein|nr:hypothetical protein [Burkholderiales bacterium]